MTMKKILTGIWLARQIAKFMLLIKATTYRLSDEKPYLWACGMFMRIYNDNRMLLGNFLHRMTVARGFVSMIKKKGINPDFIIGTMTSGIAPAGSVAMLMNKKLLVHNGEFYLVYNPKLWDKDYLKKLKSYSPDLVISSSPTTIPAGVQYANKLKLPFAYARKEIKNHGKGQLVEGIVKPGMKFILVTGAEGAEESNLLMERLEKEFGIFCVNSFEVESPQVFNYNLKGKKAVVIEDLFSTGGSSAYEVYKARLEGLICDYCFSIFSYGFSCLKKQFLGKTNISNKEVRLSKPCKIDSLLKFPILVGEMRKARTYPPTVINEMEEEINTFDERYQKFLKMKTL